MEPVHEGRPLFCLPSRAYRCYAGGALLDAFLGEAPAGDGHRPEGWIASTTRANNGPTHPPDEGLSRVRLPDGTAGPFLADVLKRRGDAFFGPGAESGGGVPFLCKFLDSAVRLPVQCHPDRAFARAHYGSEHGKTECWIVLDTRPIAGEEPYLLLGFRPGVTREDFADAVRQEDGKAMAATLHRVPVRPGDAWFIPGRFPHAIGPGVFMLEVQEPTDWVVQPETHCAGTPLADGERWGPLSPELALDCFAYQSESIEAIRKRLYMTPRTEHDEPGGNIDSLADERYGHCFTVRRMTVSKSLPIPRDSGSLLIVTAGSGCIRTEEQTDDLRQGDACLLPRNRDFVVSASQAPLTAYLVRASEM